MFVKRSSLLAAGLAALVAAAFAPEAAAQTCPSVSVAVDAPPIVKRGGNFFYKLTVTNHGQGTVSGFEVAVNTPALTTVRKSPSRKAPTTVGNGPLGTVVQVPSLASGKSVTLSLRLGVDKCAPEVLTVGALGRLTGSLDCSTPVPDAVLEVKGDNSKCANIQPSPLPGDLTLAQIAALYNTPQGTSLPSYVATGITCTGKYALCAFAACRIVSTDTNPPLAECGCYGYTNPPPGNDSISLLSQNLLNSAQAQAQDSACAVNPTSCQAVNTAYICPKLREPKPDIYDKKFDIISTFNPYTWPASNSTISQVLPTNSFCTTGQFANCCTAGCFTQRSWNGFNTTCYCPVYNYKTSDKKIFYVGEGTCEGSRGFNLGSIVYSGMSFINLDEF